MEVADAVAVAQVLAGDKKRKYFFVEGFLACVSHSLIESHERELAALKETRTWTAKRSRPVRWGC
jgi:hypothetical protein